MTILDPRWLKVLRRMRDLGGWRSTAAIGNGDGREVALTLEAMWRSGLVHKYPAGQRSAIWLLTATGEDAIAKEPGR